MSFFFAVRAERLPPLPRRRPPMAPHYHPPPLALDGTEQGAVAWQLATARMTTA